MTRLFRTGEGPRPGMTHSTLSGSAISLDVARRVILQSPSGDVVSNRKDAIRPTTFIALSRFSRSMLEDEAALADWETDGGSIVAQSRVRSDPAR